MAEHGYVVKKNRKRPRPKQLRKLPVRDLVNTFDEETCKKALNRIHTAIADAGLSKSRYMYLILNEVTETRCVSSLPSLAVARDFDGRTYFLINPEFVLSLADEASVMWACMHETLHIGLRHVFADASDGHPARRNAEELVINKICNQTFNMRMPKIKVLDEDGQEQYDEDGHLLVQSYGIDPDEFYSATYLPAVKAAGLDPLSKKDLYESVEGCYQELLRIPSLNPNKHAGELCDRSQGEVFGGDDGAGSGGQGGEDGEGYVAVSEDDAADIVSEAIGKFVAEAARNGQAKEHLGRIVAASGGVDAAGGWAAYGVSEVLGTASNKPVQYWLNYLQNVFGSMIEPVDRLRVPIRMLGVYAALGSDPCLTRGGERTVVRAAVFNDFSGSMGAELPKVLGDLVGTVPDCHVDYFMFDHEIRKLEPGDALIGSGATDFQLCVDVAEGRREVEGELYEDYDIKIVVTDGHAPPVHPEDPETWLWLVTRPWDYPERSGTALWMSEGPCPMETVVVDPQELYEASLD